ncbi:MAG: DUF104 domain-containing protein [Chloroflexi bacterium]|nr:DUF104 domain-containing protein [Chloroflexota bacterium]
MTSAIQTVEAVYERGYLRPLEPIENREGLIYIVTVVDPAAAKRTKAPLPNLRGKYRNRLSSTEEYFANKQIEKALER